MNEFAVKILYGKTEKSTSQTVDYQKDIKIIVPVASRILQNLMVDKANQAYEVIREIPITQWLDIFVKMGKAVQHDITANDFTMTQMIRVASSCSGISVNRLKKALIRVAQDMIEIKKIVENQVEGRLSVFDNLLFSEDKTWGYIPCGKNIAVKIPGNYPTININWLLLLSMKRPVLLSASYRDPVTAFIFAKELYRQGIPDGAISILYDQFDTFQNRCDQLMVSGSIDEVTTANKLKTKYYHNGKSKIVMLEEIIAPTNTYKRMAHLSMRGSGKLCTNLSTLLVLANEALHAELLAKQMLSLANVYNVNEADTILPFFTAQEAEAYEELLKEALDHGAIDNTQKVSGLPLVFKKNAGKNYIRPTVLIMDEHNPIFNTELPFPFVIVCRTELEHIPALCRESLIVSLIGDNKTVLNELLTDPTLDKVFSGDHFDRGYHPTDTHEGFLFDFIFQKKTIVLC